MPHDACVDQGHLDAHRTDTGGDAGSGNTRRDLTAHVSGKAARFGIPVRSGIRVGQRTPVVPRAAGLVAWLLVVLALGLGSGCARVTQTPSRPIPIDSDCTRGGGR